MRAAKAEGMRAPRLSGKLAGSDKAIRMHTIKHGWVEAHGKLTLIPRKPMHFRGYPLAGEQPAGSSLMLSLSRRVQQRASA